MTSKSDKRGDKHSRRRLARLNAVQAFYQMGLEQKSPHEVVSEFETHRLGAEIDGVQFKDTDKTFFRDLVIGASERQGEIDAAISAVLDKDRKLERLELVLQALLRVSTYELMARIDFPAKVVIAEYVGLARSFFGGNEPSFVNGVLDRLARDMRSAEFE
ncbi:transcription antitermination factor NusB [Sneathiella chinensis]|uniref:Transcription antitermination protein NusB n=1 Tax=Sneathiella chinensis TaxID=349750 RepID=A0ABQ5U3S7_9PROT|nr:transcription antitermination factor NusB [Sneathiella chinensis]GLQ06473.1 N utilization substance protein B [Sneathiella chinensis]